MSDLELVPCCECLQYEANITCMQGDSLYALGEWVELANGCLCCSVKDDFLRTLETLVQQQHRFDYILVETTGVLLILPDPLLGASCVRVLP
jgi:G3E family GTPase